MKSCQAERPRISKNVTALVCRDAVSAKGLNTTWRPSPLVNLNPAGSQSLDSCFILVSSQQFGTLLSLASLSVAIGNWKIILFPLLAPRLIVAHFIVCLPPPSSLVCYVTLSPRAFADSVNAGVTLPKAANSLPAGTQLRAQCVSRFLCNHL